MPYGPHTRRRPRADARGARHRQRRRAVRRHPRARSGPAGLDLPEPEPELRARGPSRGPGRPEPDRPRLVPRRRRLSPLDAGRRRPAPPAGRVVHGLHAVPARDQPGHAPEHLRVRVADRRADGSRRRLGVALRRRRGDGRGGADDLSGDPPRAGPRRRGPSIRTTAQTARDVLRRRARASRRSRVVADGPDAGHDRPRGARAAARPTRTARSPASSPASRTSSGCSSRWPRSAGSRTPPARCSSAVVEPVSLAVLAPPGAYGADIAAGEGQPLGIAPQYGGPYLGLLASTDALVRQIPGRLVGMTTDLDGKRAFVMTMRAREQDIRRDKAASNICTNQALLALAASIYVATIGPHGLRDVAALGAARAAELEAALAAVGVGAAPSGPVPQRVRGPRPDARGRPPAAARPRRPRRPRPRRRRARRAGPRRRAARLRDGGHDERRDRAVRGRARRRAGGRLGPSGAPDARRGAAGRDGADGSGPMSVVGERLQPTLFERSRPGRGGGKIPHPPKDALDRIPAAARRATPPALPELNEPEVVRHYVNLSQLNYAIDTGFYPLGSCTMKFNPKLNEWAARLPGLRDAPPARARRDRPGHAPAALGARGDPRRGQRDAGGHAPAGRRRPGRAVRDPDDPGVPPQPRRHRARRGPRPGLLARDEPGDGDDGRASGRSRSRRRPTAASTSTRSGRRSGRGPRRS